MKTKLLLFFVFISSTYCYSQLKTTSGENIYISGSDFLYTNEDIVNDGTITLGTGTLYVAGNIDNNATLTLSNGTLKVTGNKNQTFDFGTSDSTKRLELDKSSGTATLNSGKLMITDGLLSTQGTLNGGEKLIMRSTASKTAIVEQSTGGAIDNIVVERYIPAKRAFRLLSSPVNTSNTIKYNWQENQNNTSTSYANNSNTAAGYGTHIAGSTTGANGFDATLSGASSLFVFGNTAQTWSAISNTTATNALVAGAPFRLMVRGDRSIDMSTNTPTPTTTTLRTSGTLKIGSYTNTNLSSIANGYNFIGNPYQSAVNMSGVLTNSSNLNTNFYYVWDPKVGGANGRGAYVTYTFAGNTNSVSGSAVNQYLQPMQACFVKTLNNGAASITFNESDKYVAATNENVYKTANTKTNTATASLRLTLYEKEDFDNLQTPTDGALLLFNDNYSNTVDSNDANKMSNLDETMSVVADNTKLSIGSFQYPQDNTVYPIIIDQYRYANYTLVADLGNYNGLIPYIHDKFSQTYTEVNSTINYPFSVDANNALSSANNRFEVVYKTSSSLGIADFTTEAVSLYPNPSTNNEFNLQLPHADGNYNVKVCNILGQEIPVKLIETNPNTIHCETATTTPPGLYQVIITKDNSKIIKKWIKE
ncbi:MAG: T9SS type A sorting domain-containing protein [Flavobacterium sp.]|nr:T9SS type A sorting domain-containing protein [Flavobacterium sp.]